MDDISGTNPPPSGQSSDISHTSPKKRKRLSTEQLKSVHTPQLHSLKYINKSLALLWETPPDQLISLTLTTDQFSDLVDFWNRKTPEERAALAAQCRQFGHERVRMPGGRICRRCLDHVWDDGEDD